MLRNKDDRLRQKAACSPGGKRAHYLTDLPAPEGQDEPTPAKPLSAHKVMCGAEMPPRLPSFK
jgi:hypothetical protein